MKKLTEKELPLVLGGDGDETSDMTDPGDEDSKKIYVGGLPF